MKKLSLLFFSFASIMAQAQQQLLTPETLWKLGRVSAQAPLPDGNTLLYTISNTDLVTEKSNKTQYLLNVSTGESKPTTILQGKQFVQWDKNGLYALNDGSLFVSKDNGVTWTRIHSGLKEATNVRIAADGKTIAFSMPVALGKVKGNAKYNDVPNSTAYIFEDLDIRHWDYWNDGSYSHIFLTSVNSSEQKDIMKDEPYYAPQVPFGGAEDFVFSNDGKTLIYVCKKAKGKAYAQSTNTDLYAYDLNEGTTTNWSKGMMGYDTKPLFSPDGNYIAWTSMARDGFEADKTDLIIMDLATKKKTNLTAAWNETVDGDFIWSNDAKTIYFNAAYRGTQQLFSVNITTPGRVKQITDGQFDITGVVAQNKKEIIVSRTDMNHSAELYKVSLANGSMKQMSHANDDVYAQTAMCSSELKMVTTSDGKQMGVWVVYPPNFDKTKKYPTLLYCQGGPQSALTQFYSVRWNFALMAANGYIVVAPNRRGMPGWGTQWNEAISKDWGGQPMRDYLAAIDAVSKETYVDKNRLGCVGASYGGYSVFMLAGIHQNRFKTFIAHDGLFDMKSWYGTTEELWFANFDLGGNYWQKNIPDAYTKFNPSNYIDQWNTPIMVIQGGIDFRVPIEQGLQAFQAAQLKGIKSKLLYLPNENHWVLHPHNGLVWQREFFGWLKETL
ncbi:S9 family peptidase [Taibaiella sp. KBW10]|uniref:S9 family peptidase n=1 Tax=Taibaiella sp. KBW10 TaxID=2153357 RepID=UPI000F59A29E|nr:S9 family peptidase [Taibaiella sp. KBW10]RQO29987.1 S9 family peptidase [Taibaiella sp. KBW10]